MLESNSNSIDHLHLHQFNQDSSSISKFNNNLKSFPACWGHRGASAKFPENTLSSFDAAIKDGAEGIESDVHITTDDVLLMFHDVSLDRTTNGTGKINLLPYLNVIENFKTLKSPHQKIPTFIETLNLLMLPENLHVTFNIDCKPTNHPEKLFKLINQAIQSFENHEKLLNPRLILGLWHPKFLEPSARLLPNLKRAYIGDSPSLARQYFWESCHGFSMQFSCLVGSTGANFRRDCKQAGKKLWVWTVNDRLEMIEATKWGVDAILTDHTSNYLKLRNQMKENWSTISAETSYLFPYSSFHYLDLVSRFNETWSFYNLTRSAGPFRPITSQ